MKRHPVIAMAGGGTGGHLFPALAIAEELKICGAGEIVFFGTARGPEARIVPQRGYRFHKIWIKGYPRKLKPEALLIPIKLITALFQCMYHLTKLWPDCIVATGGYVCLPMMLAGKLLGKPMVIHEQNSLPGVTTRIGARWAKAVFYSFAASGKYFSYHQEAVLSGNPVTVEFGSLTKEQALGKLGLDLSRKTLLVFGGSQGAASLNRAVKEKLKDLSARYNVIWGAGKGNVPGGIPAGVLAGEFFDDMQTIYTAADLAVCRSGAMTLAEIAARGLPAVLVPFPYAAEDHQRFNAEPMAEAGAVKLILDKDFNGEVLLKTVGELFTDTERLAEMSEKMRSFYRPGARKIIAERVMKIANRE